MYKAEDLIVDNGFEDVVIYSSPSYDDALIGVTVDNRSVYDYEKMIDSLVEHDDFTQDEAIEWIDYNIIGFYSGSGEQPIVMYPLDRSN